MDTISLERRGQILDLLSRIENEYHILIIHAVESGSRAWGFPSQDSDYDIRFIYYHPKDWYLSPFEKKDHIDVVIHDDLDAGGWDLAKVLRLLNKGNAVVHEWLNSPVVYLSDSEKYETLKQFACDAFNPTSAFYHYYSQVKKRLGDDKTRRNAKSFLYCFRSLLCAKWIEDKNVNPPVLFDQLVRHYLDEPQQIDITKMLDTKSKGAEGDSFSVPEKLWAYTEDQYRELNNVSLAKLPLISQADYELIFRSLLEQ